MADVLAHPDVRSSQDSAAKTRLKIVDCDIHPSLNSRAELNPFLSRRWQEHLKTYGDHLREGTGIRCEVFPKGEGRTGVRLPLTPHPKTGHTYPAIGSSCAPKPSG